MYIRFVCVYYVGIFFLFLSDEKECFRLSSLYIYNSLVFYFGEGGNI